MGIIELFVYYLPQELENEAKRSTDGASLSGSDIYTSSSDSDDDFWDSAEIPQYQRRQSDTEKADSEHNPKRMRTD